jgi:hypothetical protein
MQLTRLTRHASHVIPVTSNTPNHHTGTTIQAADAYSDHDRSIATRISLNTGSARTSHSFAVHMLGLLLRQTVAALGEAHTAGDLTSAQVKRLLIGNPMRKLQLLLGHRNEATVYTYLDVLDEAQEIVALALEQWEAQASALDQLGDGLSDGSDMSVTA